MQEFQNSATRKKKMPKPKKEDLLKFIYSEKASKFCEISTVDLSYVTSHSAYVETETESVGAKIDGSF